MYTRYTLFIYFVYTVILMAYDFFIYSDNPNDKVAIPEWVSAFDDAMKPYTSYGEVDYRGVFTKAAVLSLADGYAKSQVNGLMGVFKQYHDDGLAYVSNSDRQEFTIEARYWSSDAY